MNPHIQATVEAELEALRRRRDQQKTPTATRPTEGHYLYRLAYAAIQQAQGRYYTHNPRETRGELEEAMDEVIVDMAQQVKTRRLKGIPK